MKTLVPVERETELQIKIREALASRFGEFPLFVTLGLWLCILPVVMAFVGWIWGFREALIASLIILAVMITVCLAFCLRVKVCLRNLSDLSAQRAKGNVRR